MDDLDILASSRGRMEDEQARSNLAVRIRLATAALFLVCVFAFPCVYFLYVLVGITPLSTMIGLTAVWLALAVKAGCYWPARFL